MEDPYMDPEDYYVPEPDFQTSYKDVERTSKRGLTQQFLTRATYFQTRPKRELAEEEIINILKIYAPEESQVFSDLQKEIFTIPNLQFYHPLLLVLATLFKREFGKLTKSNLEEFIEEYDTKVAQEDLVRYIRLVL